LRYVKSAAETVGKNLKSGATVVLESTVYPGVTEEVVATILDLENESGLKCGADFKIGYSPERINPGDEAHALTKITKIVAGMDKLFCKQKPLLKIAYASFCFAKRNISLVKFLKLFKRKVYYGVDIQGERAGYEVTNAHAKANIKFNLYPLRITHYRLRIHITHYPLPITHYALPKRTNFTYRSLHLWLSVR